MDPSEGLAVASPPIGLDQARDRIAACLAPSEPGPRLGIEIEWLVVDRRAPSRVVPADEVLEIAAGPLPHGGAVSVEPGGQLELSAVHCTSVAAAIAQTERDADELARRCDEAGVDLVALGLDPVRHPERTLDKPRYRAMEEVFDRAGPRPMAMATATAAVQLNVDTGPRPLERWRLADLLGPVLLALFANSPFHDGRATGWQSTRQLFWAAVPSGRGAPVPTWDIEAWIDHVLDTDVLYVDDGDDARPVLEPMTLRGWLDGRTELGGRPLRPPTLEDVDTHLTTVFPPVRPRGFLELRMLDSVPVEARLVAAAVTASLLTDDSVRDEVVAACRPVVGRWHAAAEGGLADPALAQAAERCLRITAASTEAPLRDACEAWLDRYVSSARSPAHDALDRGPTLKGAPR